MLTEALPELLGGSADLTHSNNTVTRHTPAVKPGELDGRYLHYGVREHAMAAFMNGVALHKAASSPTAAPSWSSPTTAARRSACRP